MKSLPCLLRTVIPAGAVFPPQGLPPNTNPNARLFRHRGGRQDVFISATADDYYSTPAMLIVNDNETEIIEHSPYDEWITGYGISGPNFEPGCPARERRHHYHPRRPDDTDRER